ncbi:MAG TPA: APC family permease [Gemmatimonadaceae bacterium]|nr:APC family permease [Gemmatimonadaceae bacterium]
MTDIPAHHQRHTSQASASDSRLLRAVGMWALAASIVNVTIGGGIFRLPAGVYATLGQASPIAYVVCAVLMGLIVMCFAEAGSRVSLTGGLYAYVETAFGPLIGFVSGVLLWAGMTSALSAVAVFFGDAVGALVPALASAGMRNAVIVIVLALFAGLNVLGVANATRFNVLMTIAKLAPLGLVIVVGLAALNGDRLEIAAAPKVGDLARGSIFLIFAFLGIESALVPSGEVKDPARTMPRAIAIAMIGIVIVYMCVQLVSQSALGDALGTSKTPVADAAGALLGSWGRTTILVGSTISMFGYVSGMTLAVPRMLYAFGRDGFLPKPFAAVHERFRTPHVAIVVQALISMALAVTGTFERLAIIANGSILIVYGACALAVFQLRRRDVRGDQPPFVAPLGGIVPALALLAILWLMTSLTAPEWVAMGVAVLAALAIYAVTRRRRAQLAE